MKEMATVEDKNDLNSILKVDRMIHEPARFLVMAYLVIVESADFLFLANQTGLSRGNLSSHLSKLEDAGYIEVHKEFVKKIPRTVLSLTENGNTAFHIYCKHIRNIQNNIPDDPSIDI